MEDNEDYLQSKVAFETSENDFSDLPFRFAEISKVLLDVYVSFPIPPRAGIQIDSSASDDLENPDRLRSLLKDLREARQAKSRDGLKKLDHSELSVRRAPVDVAPFHKKETDITALSAFKPLLYRNQRNPPLLRSLNGYSDAACPRTGCTEAARKRLRVRFAAQTFS